MQTLADYLEKGAQNDMEKTRAIYVWLTKNISYDWEEYTSGLIGSYSAEEILGRRKAVCGGFASLFLALGEAMGLEVQKVVGYAKGFGYSQGDKFHDTNHAWNIAKIDGEWKIFDATWGEGYAEVINGKTVTTKEFEDYWFDVPPYEAIFSRLPKKRNLSFVEPLLSLSGFEKLPYVEKTYFKIEHLLDW